MNKTFANIFLLCICFCAGISMAIGQTSKFDPGIVISDTDPRINKLVERYNKTHDIHGFRIQIISSSKKDLAKKAKSKFASQFQNIQAHEIYQQPFFIIKVGDFLTKLEAEKFHGEIEMEFSGSFILPDVIDPFDQYVSEGSD